MIGQSMMAAREPHLSQGRGARAQVRSRSPKRSHETRAQLSQVGRRIYGWVKSFKDGWGFLNSVHFPGDLFVGTKENPDIDVGRMVTKQPVSFEVNKGASGKPEAVNVKVV